MFNQTGPPEKWPPTATECKIMKRCRKSKKQEYLGHSTTNENLDLGKFGQTGNTTKNDPYRPQDVKH